MEDGSTFKPPITRSAQDARRGDLDADETAQPKTTAPEGVVAQAAPQKSDGNAWNTRFTQPAAAAPEPPAHVANTASSQSSARPVPSPTQSASKTARAVSAHPTTPRAPTTHGSNLADLRNKILHEATATEFHKQAAAAQADEHSPGSGTEQKLMPPQHDAGASGTTSPLRGPELRRAGPPPTPTEKSEGAAVEVGQLEAEHETVFDADTVATPAHHAIPNVRTYGMDLAEAVQDQRTSLVSAVAAEEVRRAKPEFYEAPDTLTSSSFFNKTTFFLLGATAVLLVLSVGGFIYFALSENSGDVLPAATNEVPVFFTPDEQEQINITGLNRSGIVNLLLVAVSRTNVQLGATTHYYLTQIAVGPTGREELQYISAADFLFKLGAHAPHELYRSFQPLMMFGVHEFNGNEPFLIFQTYTYDQAYAGMLEWERTMNADLAPVFGYIVNKAITHPTLETSTARSPIATPAATTSSSTATTTDTGATSTPSTAPAERDATSQSISLSAFEDEVIANKEARVLRGDKGEVVVLWSFIDQQTIVITTDPATMQDIVRRINAQR